MHFRDRGQGGGKPGPYPVRASQASRSRVGAGLAPALVTAGNHGILADLGCENNQSFIVAGAGHTPLQVIRFKWWPVVGPNTAL